MRSLAVAPRELRAKCLAGAESARLEARKDCGDEQCGGCESDHRHLSSPPFRHERSGIRGACAGTCMPRSRHRVCAAETYPVEKARMCISCRTRRLGEVPPQSSRGGDASAQKKSPG